MGMTPLSTPIPVDRIDVEAEQAKRVIELVEGL